MAEQNKKGGLDRRQRDIKVGAGLEESRYNVEFIDFLRKWGSTILLVIAATAMAFYGYQRYRENREAKAGIAFGDVDAALVPGSGQDVNPDVLVRIAQDNEGQGAVSIMARLAAAEQWRVSAMKGFKPASADPKTGAVKKEDELSPEQKKVYLENARQQYQTVVDMTSGNKAKATFTLAGLMGLAAVAEANGKVDDAKGAYKQAEALAEATHYPEYAALAKSRAENVEKFSTPVILLPDAMVMSWDKPAPVAPSPAPGSSLISPDPLSPNLGNTLPNSTGVPVVPTINLPPTTVPPPATDPSKPAEPAAPAPSANPPAVPPATPAPAPEPKKDEPKKP